MKIKEEQVDKMERLIQKFAKYSSYSSPETPLYMKSGDFNEFRDLVEELPTPESQELIVARNILAQSLEQGYWFDDAHCRKTPNQFRNGYGDDSGVLKLIVKALKAARGLNI